MAKKKEEVKKVEMVCPTCGKEYPPTETCCPNCAVLLIGKK